MTRQAFEIAVPVPPLANTSTRRARFKLHREKAEQQNAVRRHLDLMGRRPSLPCRVTLVRISRTRLDSDGPVMALKYVRDTVARWIHGLDEVVPRMKNGRPVLDPRGRVEMTRPEAPDGPNDGITWAYGQRPTKKMLLVLDERGRPELTASGRPKRCSYQAVRIVIEELRKP